MIAYFDTNSCAEFYWLTLYELINNEWLLHKKNWSKPKGSAMPSEESVLHLKDGINKLHLDI